MKRFVFKEFFGVASDIFHIIPEFERGKLKRVVSMLFVMAALDALGVASIMPFIAVVTAPDMIHDQPILNWLFKFFAFESTNSFTVVLGLSVLGFLLFSLSFKALAIYHQLKFSMKQEAVLGDMLMERYLNQSYIWLAKNNSAEFEQVIFTEVHQFVFQGLAPLLLTIAQSCVALCIFLVLLIADYTLALTAMGVLGSSYLLLFTLVRSTINRVGVERFQANKERFKVVSEAFGSPKVIKMLALERFFQSKFSKSTHVYADRQGQGQMLSQLPKFVLEGVAFGSLILVILYLFSSYGKVTEVIPLMTLFAMAGYRMMPALQQIYIGFSNMRIAKPAIDKIKSDLALPVEEVGLKSLSSDTIELNHQIEFRNVGFSHHGIVDKTVSDLSLMILRGSHVAFVGATGSGKTTVVDLICGLLEQVDGDILIDGKEITARRLKNWQDQIGYVTQSTFLIDDTIAKNVAFGVADEDINLERVKRALLVAQLSDFAQDGNPGLMTIVGERGSRLSGGQIQRIGIARALYRQPKILVLDEATSALDARTERLVIDGIIKAKGSYTIMSIAHRISTVVECDKIFVLDGGCLVGEGTASELIVSSEKFRVLTSPISYQEDQNDKA